jgi:hypothetical protein
MDRKNTETMAEALRYAYKACETPKEWKPIEELIVKLANMYAEESETFDKDEFLGVVFS